MPVDFKVMYEGIMSAAGGVENIASLGCCMTRLRFTVKEEAKVDTAAFRKVPGVAGYFYSGVQHQLIVGPSTASKLAAYCNEQHAFAPLGGGAPAETAKAEPGVGNAKEVKASVKKKYSSKISKICSTIGNIFIPLIPAYIGCGLILGVNNILSKSLLAGPEYANTTALLGVFGNAIFFYLNAIVGYNANKEFGGTPSLGVVFAGILSMPALANVVLFGQALTPARGGIIAVLLVCWFGSYVEKLLRKVLKGTAEMFLNPTLTILFVGMISLIAIQPLAGWLSDMLSHYTQVALKQGGFVTGFLLGAGFLPLVMLGIHQSLIPIHQQLIEVLGNNPLFPILCMAGAGQVGAGFAVLFKTKNFNLKNITKGCLPIGILGIGEPLIYGVTLPLFKPFIGACIGAAFGGALCAVFHVTATIPFGVSGVVLLLALTDMHSVIYYTVSFLVAVVAGFAATWFLGFDDPQNEEA